jgi:hypothetical protein
VKKVIFKHASSRDATGFPSAWEKFRRTLNLDKGEAGVKITAKVEDRIGFSTW